jgi:uncharacterized protein
MDVWFNSLAGWGLTRDILFIFAIGFIAQMIDGALGMAFGLISSTGLMALGVHPATASAVVHTAEIATTGAAGASHAWFQNINWRLFRWLAISGMIGGIAGALVLSHVNSKMIQPFVAGYLLIMGLLILLRAMRMRVSDDVHPDHAAPLGLAGGFLDAIGGGGWGALVTSSLVGSGRAPRFVIGTVSASEFCVTFAISIAFFTQLGFQHVGYIFALATGGLLAAPFGAIVAKSIRPQFLMIAVGCLVVGLALLQLWRLFG